MTLSFVLRLALVVNQTELQSNRRSSRAPKAKEAEQAEEKKEDEEVTSRKRYK